MKNSSLARFLAGLAGLLLFLAGHTMAQVAPITTEGNQVLFGGQPGSIAGPSLFWSNDGWGGEKFYTSGAVETAKSDWNASLIRAAMGVEDPGGYLQSPASNLAKVRTVVEAAIAQDLYVIIDWHSHHAEQYTQQAVSFFQQMAQDYGHHPHVIYEIYNEPLQVSWSNTIKPYAETVIAAIRAIDPDNLIVVGTPTWSQDVDAAANDPITGYNNIAYALHFYAGTHGQGLRNKAQYALNQGIPLFATEWGTVNADGDGGVNHSETYAWMEFLQNNNISHANWALNDKVEGASALVPGANPNGSWSSSDYTVSGAFVRDIVRDWPPLDGGTTPPPDPEPDPGPGDGSGSCEYVVNDNWGSGFVASIRITNNSSTAINGWSVNWAYSGSTVMTNGWNANFSGSNPYSASNLGWNASIQPGNTVEFGFQGQGPAEVPQVTGSVCD